MKTPSAKKAAGGAVGDEAGGRARRGGADVQTGEALLPQPPQKSCATSGFVFMPPSEALQLVAASWRGAASSVTESFPWREAPRLLGRPLFFLLLAVFVTAAVLRCVASLLWSVVAPLLMRNCDLVTWLLSTDAEYFKDKVVWITGGTPIFHLHFHLPSFTCTQKVKHSHRVLAWAWFLTGGSSGLGLNLAKHIAALGCRGLILTSRRKTDLERARGEVIHFCKQRGVTVAPEDFLLLPLDLSVGVHAASDGDCPEAEARWRSAVREAIEWREGVDVLVNNAGAAALTSGLPPSTVSLRSFSRQTVSTLRSSLLASQAAWLLGRFPLLLCSSD